MSVEEDDPVSEEEESIELDESDSSPMEGESPPPLLSSILDDRLRFDKECARLPRPDEGGRSGVKLTVGICVFHLDERSVEAVPEPDTGMPDVVGTLSRGEAEGRDGEDKVSWPAARRIDVPDRVFRDAKAACCMARAASYSARCVDDSFSKSASAIS